MTQPVRDLVDEMQWEDIIEVEGGMLTLEECGFEEPPQDNLHGIFTSVAGSIYSYVEWFYDNDESAFSVM